MRGSLEQIKRQPASYANFYHNFGYLLVEDFASKNDFQSVVASLDTVVQTRRKESLQDALKKGGLFEGAIVEEFGAFADFFFSPAAVALLEVFLGKEWLYLGSDLSLFTGSIQPWHRDWMCHLPIMKMGCYLHMQQYLGGELRYIPGSHKIGDQYANTLQKALAWPRNITQGGGMNERGFFPPNHDYSLMPTNGRFGFLETGAGDESNPASSKFSLPHVALKPKAGDIVLFDNRGIHGGTVGLPSVVRIMTTALFCPNPFDMSFDYASMGIKQSAEELAKEMVELLANDRLFHHNRHTYHPAGLEPKLDRRHLIKLFLDADDSVAASFGASEEKYAVPFNTKGYLDKPERAMTEDYYTIADRYARF